MDAELMEVDPKAFFSRKRKHSEDEEDGVELWQRHVRSTAPTSLDPKGDFLSALFAWRASGDDVCFAFEKRIGADRCMMRGRGYPNTVFGAKSFVQDARDAVKIHMEPCQGDPKVVDIDADAYGNLRSCDCATDEICRSCWLLVKFGAYYAYHTLKNAGIEPMIWFSGRRGFHIAVVEKAWRDADVHSPALVRLLTPPRLPRSFIYWPAREIVPDADGRMTETRFHNYVQKDMLTGRGPMIPALAAMEILIRDGAIFANENSLFRVVDHIPGGAMSTAGKRLIEYIKPVLGIIDSPRYSNDSADGFAESRPESPRSFEDSNSSCRYRNIVMRWNAWVREHSEAADNLAISILSPRIDENASKPGHLIALPGLPHPDTGALCAIFTKFISPETRYDAMTRRFDEISPDERKRLMQEQTIYIKDATRARHLTQPVAERLSREEEVSVSSVTPTKPKVVRRT